MFLMFLLSVYVSSKIGLIDYRFYSNNKLKYSKIETFKDDLLNSSNEYKYSQDINVYP